MTTPMAISKCFRLTKSTPLRSLIQLYLNPIVTANSFETAAEFQSNLRSLKIRSPNPPLRNDVAAAIRNQVNLAAMVTRGDAVKIDDEFNNEDVEDDSDEFEDEDEDEEDFDEMDAEDCDDEDEEDPGYKKRK